MSSRYTRNFTPHQREALLNADVTYDRGGTRCGWTGHIVELSGNKFTVDWDQQHYRNMYQQEHGYTTYCSGALLHPEEKYIKLSNEALLMSYLNTVTSSHFYMVIDHNGNQKTGMIAHDEAIDKAVALAQESTTKENFFVVKSDEKIYATRAPVTREHL